jgi:hypothetical protein
MWNRTLQKFFGLHINIEDNQQRSLLYIIKQDPEILLELFNAV